MTTTRDEDEIEQNAEGIMFDNALIGGDPLAPVTRADFERLVKLCGSRFDSAARRSNKGRKESRDGITALRSDLGPVILASKLFPLIGTIATAIPFILVILTKA